MFNMNVITNSHVYFLLSIKNKCLFYIIFVTYLFIYFQFKHQIRKANVKVKIVRRFDLDQTTVNWADVIFTAGGDGTYLLAANKFLNTSKPLIGLNTDPER